MRAMVMMRMVSMFMCSPFSECKKWFRKEAKSPRQETACQQREKRLRFLAKLHPGCALLRRRRCREPLWGCPHSHYLESVISRLRNRTANEPADSRTNPGGLPEWLLA